MAYEQVMDMRAAADAAIKTNTKTSRIQCVVHDKPVSPKQSSRNGLLVGCIKACKIYTLQADPSGRTI